MADRIARLQSLRSEFGVDAIWLTSLPNIRWACGFTGSNGLLVVRDGGAHFVSDGRYTTQARQEVRGAEIHIHGPDLVASVEQDGLLDDCRRILFQSDRLTVSDRDRLDRTFPDVEWSGVADLLTAAVASKDADEIRKIRAAQEITDTVYAEILGWLRPGQSEKDIAAEIVYRHLRRGAEKMSFEPIVASGPNSALPHARPTDRRIAEGDVLLLDFGCFLEGYASDMTRTIAIGDVEPEARRVYDIVLEAQLAAIQGSRAEMPADSVDALARAVIGKHGYGESFTHGLGHGIGLETHEWPRVASSVGYVLPRDAVVSIEPGIYLPGRFGVRIEDLVVLREEGAEVLTASPKEWRHL